MDQNTVTSRSIWLIRGLWIFTGFAALAFGANGIPGGTGINGQIGNWPGSVEKARQQLNSGFHYFYLAYSVIMGAFLSFLFGLPVYALARMHAARQRDEQSRLTLRALHTRAYWRMCIIVSLTPAIIMAVFACIALIK